MTLPMRIDIITLFPSMFTGPLTESIIKRAVESNTLQIKLHNLRDYALDKHGTVDDSPYGGGAGMVLKVDVMDRAIESIIKLGQTELKTSQQPHILMMTPQGEKYSQPMAKQLAQNEWLLILCGHYEGYDERIRSLVNQELSIGDFVLTGGELPAMVVIDSIARLIPGVLGKEASHQEESFENNLLEYPHYTRPDNYKDMTVPEVLLNGNHAAIAQWRKEQATKRTQERRPDLAGNS